ncbi:MAG TPA: serine hydrolase domain-containing protein [Candidatus Acidoferrales bacterium]|nr:serine hydrolase domain-containing protein [Candidatus Acidoferrales bacterium]
MGETKKLELNPERLRHLKSVVEEDIRKGLYFGGTIIVARHGKIGFHEAFGHANSERKRAVRKDSVFSLFSVTKSFTNVLVLRAIELGQFALTTKVTEIIAEFDGPLRRDATVFHLLTHSAGLPPVYTPKAGMYIDRLDEMIAAICKLVPGEFPPGTRVDYSPFVNHALLGEMVRRTDPKARSYRKIVEDEILKPLGMKDTSVGVRRDLKKRHLVPDFRGNAAINHLGHSDLGPNGAFEEEDAEMPWVGIVSTASDLFRLAEMLRRLGELDGARILSPTICKKARQNWTGDKPNEVYKRLCIEHGWPIIPAYLGLGFPLRGEAIGNHLYGTLTSPNTFGGYGAGTTIYWVDPELELTFVGLCTGVMNSADNYLRWRRLSDIAVSAAI